MKTYFLILFSLLTTVSSFAQDMLVPYLKGGKYGYLSSSTKKLVIPVQFDHAELFHGKLAYVEKDGEFGFINAKGEEVIPIGKYVTTYEEAPRFHDGLLAVVRDKKFGVVNEEGEEVIPFKYDYIGKFSEGKAAVGLLKVSTDYNFRVENYKTLNIGPISKEMTFTTRNSLHNTTDEKWGERGDLTYGFINTKGEVVVPIIYGKVGDYSEGLALVVKNAFFGKAGYFNHEGNIEIAAQYIEAHDFKHGYSHARKTNMYDKNLIASNYEHVYVLNSPDGIIDKKGKLILPTIPIDHFLGQNKNGFILESWDDRVCFSDYQGNIKIPFNEEYIHGIVNEEGPIAFLKQDSTYEFHDPNTYEIIENALLVDNLQPCQDGVFIYSDHTTHLYGVLSKTLTSKVKPKYDIILPFENGFAKALRSRGSKRITTKFFFIDKSGFEYVNLPHN